MLSTNTLGSTIFQVFARVDTCSLEELNERLPCYSWNHQVFAAVDPLNREGTVTRQRPDSPDYILTPLRSVETRHMVPGLWYC
jgi:hypothetical protein